MKKTYAVITGAADGLGRSFALACAAAGYQLLLIDLPYKKLERLACHIEQSFGTTVIIVEKDLCDADSCSQIAKIIAAQQLSISLLINNAGLGLSVSFEHMQENQFCKLIQLNIHCLTQLTYTLLPALKRHGSATIINVSSLASFFHLPFKSIYAASKAYVRSFSQSLRIELKEAGVHVSTLCPGGVNSNAQQFINTQHSGWLVRQMSLHPDTVASIALKGALQKKAVVIPGQLNRLLLIMTQWLPVFIKDRMALLSMKNVTPGYGKHDLQLYRN